MDTFDPKLLKEIASACRKAGISEFKGFGIEIKLSDNTQPTTRRRKPSPGQPQRSSNQLTDIEVTDKPTDEEILYWSVGGLPEQGNG